MKLLVSLFFLVCLFCSAVYSQENTNENNLKDIVVPLLTAILGGAVGGLAGAYFGAMSARSLYKKQRDDILEDKTKEEMDKEERIVGKAIGEMELNKKLFGKRNDIAVWAITALNTGNNTVEIKKFNYDDLSLTMTSELIEKSKYLEPLETIPLIKEKLIDLQKYFSKDWDDKLEFKIYNCKRNREEQGRVGPDFIYEIQNLEEFTQEIKNMKAAEKIINEIITILN